MRLSLFFLRARRDSGGLPYPASRGPLRGACSNCRPFRSSGLRLGSRLVTGQRERAGSSEPALPFWRARRGLSPASPLLAENHGRCQSEVKHGKRMRSCDIRFFMRFYFLTVSFIQTGRFLISPAYTRLALLLLPRLKRAELGQSQRKVKQETALFQEDSIKYPSKHFTFQEISDIIMHVI